MTMIDQNYGFITFFIENQARLLFMYRGFFVHDSIHTYSSHVLWFTLKGGLQSVYR